MRDTEHREDLAAQPFPNQRAPLPADGAQPVPVDEAGLEHGHDRGVDGNVNDGRMMDDGRGVDGVALSDRDTTPDGIPAAAPQVQDAPPVDAMPMPAAASPVHDEELFAGDVAERLRARWRELQAGFVDDPQRAVREADEVVDEVMRTITEHRERLADEWQGHTDTEHLRLALREYRSFFDRLLPS